MTYRERVHACIHPETYKYFLARDTVLDTWKRLASVYGAPKTSAGFDVVEIYAARLLLRATRMLNPITVIRLRGCTGDDIEALHKHLGYAPERQTA